MLLGTLGDAHWFLNWNEWIALKHVWSDEFLLILSEHLPLELRVKSSESRPPVFCIWSVLSPFSRESCFISPLTWLVKGLLPFLGGLPSINRAFAISFHLHFVFVHYTFAERFWKTSGIIASIYLLICVTHSWNVREADGRPAHLDHEVHEDRILWVELRVPQGLVS